MALGDSLTAGYGLDAADAYPAQLEVRLKQDGYSVRVVNAGVSGDTVRNIADRLPYLQKAYPDASYLLEAGANDGLAGRDLKDVRSELSRLVSDMKAHSKLVLLGQNIPTNYGTYAKDFEAMYDSVAKEQNVPFIPQFLRNVGGIPKLNQGDGIHPTKEGYAIIVDRLSSENSLKDLISSCK